MAEIQRTKDGYIDRISATTVNGSKTVIHGNGAANLADTLMSIFAFGGDPRERISIESVFNIKGARDGANALVKMTVNTHPGYKARVRETPEELRAIFREAGIEKSFPAIQETRRSKIWQTIFGKPYYTPVEP